MTKEKVLYPISYSPGLHICCTNVKNSLIYLGQLLGNVSPNKHGLQVDPEVLNGHPVLDDISGVGKILNPLLDLGFKWSVVPGK